MGKWDAEEWARFGSKDFVKRYRSYKERGDANAPGYLPGYFELSPQGTFHKPVIIGAKRKELPEQKAIT